MPFQPDLASRLASARTETDRLFSYLDPAAIYDRPIAERHRMIFYLGHLEAFDWNLMKHSGMAAASPIPEFDNLFALGIDPEPGKLPHDQPSDWPGVGQVCRYNQQVRDAIDKYLPSAPVEDVHMMIEHRHMHAETFAYILHSLEPGKKQGTEEHSPVEVPVVPEMMSIPSGVATLGKALETTYGWDNEFQELTVSVPQFSITRYKITNGEWLEYMRQTGAAAPHYWFQQEGQWFYRGAFQDVPLPLTWPVYVTWNQASQYAQFRKLALPTEAQFHRAAYGTSNDGQERAQPWEYSGADLPSTGNFGYARWNPVPVNSSPETESAFRIAQLVGNGWEWTSSVFAPFPGFAPRDTYPGYSANFFDNSHYVLKGASPRTSSLLVRRSLRNWFRPDYPYVYASFHLVQN